MYQPFGSLNIPSRIDVNAFLSRLTPEEREYVIDGEFRHWVQLMTEEEQMAISHHRRRVQFGIDLLDALSPDERFRALMPKSVIMKKEMMSEIDGLISDIQKRYPRR